MSIRCLMTLCLFCSIFPAEGWSLTATVKGMIGSHPLEYTAQQIDSTAEIPVSGSGEWLAITEVWPDTVERITWFYTLSAEGLVPQERRVLSQGFGKRTWFLKTNQPSLSAVALVNHTTHPLYIEAIQAVPEIKLQSLSPKDRFGLLGLVSELPYQNEYPDMETQIRVLSEQLTRLLNAPATQMKERWWKGFANEIYYAARSPQQVQSSIQRALNFSQTHDLPCLLGMVSWWMGTPLTMSDGFGRTFGDLSYQQICYTPTFLNPDNPALRTMIGDKYNLHFGLTTPNIWSSVPWLTMNHEDLNRYRARRMKEALAFLRQEEHKLPGWISGVFLENEPRYWDTDSEGAHQPNRGECWGDFNPMTVSAAAREGVTLDPTDGMSLEELRWLFINVGRYSQNTVDAFNSARSEIKTLTGVPLYTHFLQHRSLFPGKHINHTGSEWAYAQGALTGIELMWGQPSEFERVREWGPWTNLNREETDGLPLDVHLWDLRVSYLCGADYYNSYNWHMLGGKRYFDYLQTFLEEFPVVRKPAVEPQQVDTRTLWIKFPQGLQAVERIEVKTQWSGFRPGTHLQLKYTNAGKEVFHSQRLAVNAESGESILGFDFPVPVESHWSVGGTLTLHLLDPGDSEAAQAAFKYATQQDLTLQLDLEQNRQKSLWVIERSQSRAVLRVN